MGLEMDVWRTALRAKGRDWVLSELRRRPGQPEDTLYDVVHEPPFPTREFCQRWCVEEDNKFLSVPTSTKFALCALVIMIIFAGMAVHSWTSIEPRQQPGMTAAQAAASTHRSSSWAK
jgi:hypothetical protein